MTSVERSFTVTAAPSVVLDDLSDFVNTEQWDPVTPPYRPGGCGADRHRATWLNTSEVFGRTSEITCTLRERGGDTMTEVLNALP
jgi:hypothetical protein